jgi:2-keto-4-pentenoate hydratase
MTPEQLLAHYDDASCWPAGCGLDVSVAYERALSVRQLRIARGERPRGFKVGFTNRNIWRRYEVFAPIWGTVWDTTLAFCEGVGDV